MMSGLMARNSFLMRWRYALASIDNFTRFSLLPPLQLHISHVVSFGKAAEHLCVSSAY